MPSHCGASVPDPGAGLEKAMQPDPGRELALAPPPTRRKRMPLAALFLLLRKTYRIHPAVPGLELVFGHGAAHEIEHMF